MNTLATEHVVQTPSGVRVLTVLGRSGFAHLRSSFGPDDSGNAAQRLEFNSAFDHLHLAPDGTFISSRMLWAIIIGILKPGQNRSIDEISTLLFWMQPDLHKPLMKLFTEYDPDDPYWAAMVTHGWYEPATRTVHRHPKA